MIFTEGNRPPALHELTTEPSSSSQIWRCDPGALPCLIPRRGGAAASPGRAASGGARWGDLSVGVWSCLAVTPIPASLRLQRMSWGPLLLACVGYFFNMYFFQHLQPLQAVSFMGTAGAPVPSWSLPASFRASGEDRLRGCCTSRESSRPPAPGRDVMGKSGSEEGQTKQHIRGGEWVVGEEGLGEGSCLPACC